MKSLSWISDMILVPGITIFKLRLSEFFKCVIKYYDEQELLTFGFKLDELLKKLIVNDL